MATVTGDPEAIRRATARYSRDPATVSDVSTADRFARDLARITAEAPARRATERAAMDAMPTRDQVEMILRRSSEFPVWGRYALLADYLEGQGHSVVTLTFAELDQLVARGLPASARRYRSWWGNSSSNHAASWRHAGYRVTAVRLGEDVTFTHTDGNTGAGSR